MKKEIYKHIEREFYEKGILTFVILTFWLLLPKIGYENGDLENTTAHFLYMFCHANVWHLLGNLFVLWIIRGKLYLIPSLMIAFLTSLIPAWSLWGEVGVTMGFSGVIFAVYGIKWGLHDKRRYEMDFSLPTYKEFMIKAMPFALVGILIPNLNWCLHLYCLLAGYVYGRYRR